MAGGQIINTVTEISRKAFGNWILLITTVFPTIISFIYFVFIASDVYITESRFVVRSPERQSLTPLGQMLRGAGFSNAQDDSYLVQDYILSRDALVALDREMKLKMAYTSASIDLFSRFGAIDLDQSDENFYSYYQKKVRVQRDSASSITTLVVRAYTAEDALKINQRLVELSEVLVNKLNERGRNDMIRFASHEVELAKEKASHASLALAAFRDAKGVIDPERQSEIPLAQTAKLHEELISTRTHIRQLERFAKENPQLPVLRQRTELLENEIDRETRRMAGGEKSLAGKAAEYQRLVLEREFADKMLASAMSSLEQAKGEAQRQQLYLERVVQPNYPDEPVEPKRAKSILATFALGLLLFGVATMLVAGTREHLD